MLSWELTLHKAGYSDLQTVGVVCVGASKNSEASLHTQIICMVSMLIRYVFVVLLGLQPVWELLST